MKQGVQIKDRIVIHLTHILRLPTEDIGPDEPGQGLVREAAVSFRIRYLRSALVIVDQNIIKDSPAEDHH